MSVLLASDFGHVTLERFDDRFAVLGGAVPQSLKFKLPLLTLTLMTFNIRCGN